MRIDSLPYIDSPFYSVALYFMEFVYDKIYSIIKPDLSLIYLIGKGGLRLQGDPLKTRRTISAKGLNRENPRYAFL